MLVSTIEQLSEQLMLSNDFIMEFLAVANKIDLPKNSHFVNQGEVCNYIALVEKGRLFSYVEMESGDQVVDDFFLPGYFTSSYRSFLTRCPSPGSIKVYRDSTLFAISYEKYCALSKSTDWLKLFKHISDTLFIRKCYKATALASLSAIDRYSELIITHPDIEQQFPQHLIASFLHLRPESLSRLKSIDLHQ